jgi:hypothetical protein
VRSEEGKGGKKEEEDRERGGGTRERGEGK